ncbi:MAG: hypothetical protein APF80_14950 [Alphaproteobacteria bacterium BRH_c36]|nr:MAG: hypothetical protein APF80_14950 [Alphaproteobacteria bacterium BRH_c36]
MQGRIVKFHETLNVGVIRTEDGKKVRFAPADVRNPNGRLVGYDVDFVKPGPGRKAKDIILLTGSPWQVFSKPQKTNGNAAGWAS